MSKRKITFQIEQDVYEQAERAAGADRRSLSNWLAVTVERAVEDKLRESAEQPAA